MPRGNFQRVPAPDEEIKVGACKVCARGYRLTVTEDVKRHLRPGGSAYGACRGGHTPPWFVVEMPYRQYKAGMTVSAP